MVKVERAIPEEFAQLRNVSFVHEKVEKVVLECVDKAKNHNKFYILSQTEADTIRNGKTFTAQWGRIGAKPQSKKYDIARYAEGNFFEQMLSKLEKGYSIKSFKRFGDTTEFFQRLMDELGDDWELFD